MARRRFRGGAPLHSSVSAVVYPLAGAILLFPGLAAWLSLVRQVRNVSLSWSGWAPFLAGVGAYVLVHALFRRPMTLYVFGHELTHAAAACLSGYKVQSLFVSDKGGEVRLSDSNIVVALAPYCVPIYTAGVLALYALVRYYAPSVGTPLWVGVGLGFTLAFHVALTVHALGQNQPDLRQAGVFFSLVVITLTNAVVLLLVIKALFPSHVSLETFADHWGTHTRGLAKGVWHGVRDLWEWGGALTERWR